MLLENIKIIEAELLKYSTKTKSELLSDCINIKLKRTLDDYTEEVDKHSDYLLTRSSFKVLKALTKLQKNADKSVIDQVTKIEKRIKLKIQEELKKEKEGEEDEWIIR